MKKNNCPLLAIICKGDSSSSDAESGTNGSGGSDNYGSESYP
jgi:hypothetical protein